MPLVPHAFLFRVAHPCLFVDDMPLEDGDELLDLPESCRLDTFADMDGKRDFADVRLAWNERGLGVQMRVRGKDNPLVGDPKQPRASDGLSLWIDTRDARASHRASRHCHQFHFLATGGGSEGDEPLVVQTKVNRAMEDAPHRSDEILLRRVRATGGYRLDVFLPAAALHGFDPEQHPRLGVYYAVHDRELGDQTLGVGSDFPFADDPSLWHVLELVRPQKEE
jgi:hypothetical protein